jgi:hypothetical protein
MDQATYDSLPETITLRELRFQVRQRGFRPKHVTLVTTLTDARRYSQAELGDLYRARWHVETNHAHYVQRFTFSREDQSPYTGNQGIIGSGAMAPAMPA